MKEINKLLEQIESKNLAVNEAIKLINNQKPTNIQHKSKKIKIKIHDKEDNKKINLPALPLGLIQTFGSIGFKIWSKSCKNDDNKSLKGNEVKKLFSILRQLPPTKLVEIKTEDASVDIYTL